MATEIIYWRGSGDVIGELINALEKRGANVTVVRGLEQVLDIVGKRRPLMTVVDASTGDAEASKRVVELSDARNLFDIPIVFITHKALKSTEVLKKQFKSFLALELSAARTGILKEVESIIQTALPARPEMDEVEAGPLHADHAPVDELLDIEKELHSDAAPVDELREDPLAARKDKAPQTTITPGRSRVVRPVDELEELPKPVFSQRLLKNLNPAVLVSSYDGEMLAVASDLSAFDDKLLLPEHPRRDMLEDALQRMTETNPWLGLHARRVAYVSSAVITGLDLGPERDNNLRTSGMLLNWGLLDPAAEDWIRVDLFRYRSFENVDALVEAFRQSADIVSERLDDDVAARTIMIVAAMIGREDIPDTDQDLIRDATCLLVIEAIDRACWHSGIWDAFGAYRAIRSLRKGEPFTLEPETTRMLLRVLSEAVSNKHTLSNAFTGRPIEGQLANAAAAQPKRQGRNESNQFHVELADLKPGMRLVKPILAHDGRVIIPADTQVDEDLIVRLWQLAAVRPIKSPVTVVAILSRTG